MTAPKAKPTTVAQYISAAPKEAQQKLRESAEQDGKWRTKRST